MRNNGEVFQSKQFWPSIKHWLADVNQQKDPQEHIAAVHLWYDAFILSDDADDREARGEIMVLRNDLLNLFTILGDFTPDQRREKLNKYIGI